MECRDANKFVAVVLGGAGFLGRALVDEILLWIQRCRSESGSKEPGSFFFRGEPSRNIVLRVLDVTPFLVSPFSLAARDCVRSVTCLNSFRVAPWPSNSPTQENEASAAESEANPSPQFRVPREAGPNAFAEIETFLGDVRDESLVRRVCDGADVVFHAASLVDWGLLPPERVISVNVFGAQSAISACLRRNVPVLVYTSTMDVIVPKEGIEDGDEDSPYPECGDLLYGVYALTKAEAEQKVLAAHMRTTANGSKLQTVCVRPAGIYGEHDPYHVANVLREAKSGHLRALLGDGRSRFQHVYVRNVAWNHVLAYARMVEGTAGVGGSVFFALDHEDSATNFWQFMGPIVEHKGYRMPALWIPMSVALLLVRVIKYVIRSVRLLYTIRSSLNEISVRAVCVTQTFSNARARDILGYKPRYSYEYGMRRTLAYWDARTDV